MVGNSASLILKNQGIEIDSFHTVVRLNRGTENIDPELTGERTTLHFISTPHDLYLPRIRILLRAKFGAALPVLMSPKSHSIRYRRLSVDLRPFFTFFPLTWHRDLVNRLDGYQPSTGMLAIDFLLRFIEAEGLHVFGFDFWDTPNRHTGSARHTNHSARLEKERIHSLLPKKNIH